LGFGEGFRVASGDGHLRPFGNKRLRGGKTNAAGAAGNQVYLSVKRPMFFS
jgi:hypothetical protein